MRLSTISFLALASSVIAAEVKIDVTKAVECERKSQKGDKIHVHYRGNLEENGKVGKEFDASYNRGQPLSFVVGRGSVIKGYVIPGGARLCMARGNHDDLWEEFYEKY